MLVAISQYPTDLGTDPHITVIETSTQSSTANIIHIFIHNPIIAEMQVTPHRKLADHQQLLTYAQSVQTIITQDKSHGITDCLVISQRPAQSYTDPSLHQVAITQTGCYLIECKQY